MSRSLSVRALDLFLNRQILASPQGDRWWRVKIRAKRLLGLAAPQDVERLARRMLAVLAPVSHVQRRHRRLAA